LKLRVQVIVSASARSLQGLVSGLDIRLRRMSPQPAAKVGLRFFRRVTKEQSVEVSDLERTIINGLRN
jgi:hypothetical protein